MPVTMLACTSIMYNHVHDGGNQVVARKSEVADPELLNHASAIHRALTQGFTLNPYTRSREEL